MFCEHCGNKLLEGAKFCGSCGGTTEPAQPAFAAAKPSAPARPAPPPAYAPPAPAYAAPPTPAYVGKPDSEPLRVGQYIGMFLLMCVPILSIILLFMWSFGGSVNPNKKNFARATLILGAIGIVLSILFSTVLISILGSVFENLY